MMPAPALAASPSEGTQMLSEVLAGLSKGQKALPCKYLYDAEGSRLFDRICTLPEYYPTRTETGILRANAPRLAEVVPPGAVLVELGSGSSTKTRILLDALPRLEAYAPVDISAEHLQAAAARLGREYPRLAVHPVVADFTAAFPLPSTIRHAPLTLFFPGSTIGNFEPNEARALLARLRSLPRACGLVIGADLRKDLDRLVAAYDDAEGVTAAFNLNLLARLNRELGADFDLDRFAHEARWNGAAGRIEMHLVSQCRQVVHVAGRGVMFETGESIHTENSHKFTTEGFAALAAAAGWSGAEVWTDPERLFSVHVLVPAL
jgi:L-histidine Nalpha-methyltransferase